MQDGKPKYVTAVSKSDTIDGWRDRRGDGGIIIDVETNEIVCEGLSKPRYERFEGLELDQRLQDADSEPWCGVQVIDLTDGTCKNWFRIDGKIGELYDVAVMPNITCPCSYGFLPNDVLGIITLEE